MSHSNPQEDDGQAFPNAALRPFAVFATRGFGEFDHSIGIGVFPEQLGDALIRTANSRRGMTIIRGWGFP